MATFKDIVAAVETASGTALLSRLGDPHINDLPIRDPESGGIVAWIPDSAASGAKPIARRGFVIGYYKEGADVWHRATFWGGKFLRWDPVKVGEMWATFFDAGQSTVSKCYKATGEYRW